MKIHLQSRINPRRSVCGCFCSVCYDLEQFADLLSALKKYDLGRINTCENCRLKAIESLKKSIKKHKQQLTLLKR